MRDINTVKERDRNTVKYMNRFKYKNLRQKEKHIERDKDVLTDKGKMKKGEREIALVNCNKKQLEWVR